MSRIIVITGTRKGIGKELSEYYLNNNDIVIGCSRGESTINLENYRHFVLDVSDEKAVVNMIRSVKKEFGKIDILINNAGITRDNLMLRMSKEDWDTIIKVNLDSVFNLTKAVIKPMMKARSGSIINMTSVVGVKGNAGQANYAASKAGVIGFTKSVALELGSRNIRCNAIAPGFIETEMTAVLDEKTVQGWRDAIPLKRGGTPEDVANACVFFGSEMSAYVTGQVMNVDGGMLT